MFLMGFTNSIIHPRNLITVQINMASVLLLLIMSLHCLLLLSPFPLIATYSSQNFTHPLCHSHERSALLQFKESLAIDKSASQDPSAYRKLASWKLGGERSDCCSWEGVKCDEKTGHVIGLSLESSYLYGSINSTSSLFRLRHLRRLDLADNHFNCSKIPSAIGNLSRLAHLNLSSSGFCGQVPSEILWLSKLVSLDLTDNSLKLHNPGLRSVAEKLTNLYELHLSHVDISSEVPHSLANLSSLSSLLLIDCRLIGELPTGVFHLPNLRFLRVGNNLDLTGNLPELWGGNHLEFLGIAGTSFSGQIPDSIGNLSSLTTFLAGDSNLQGSLPPSLGNVTHLRGFYFARNKLRGPIPNSFLRLPNLELLDLAGNSLEGNVELDFLFKSRKLRWLHLSSNYLSVNNHISANTTPPNLSFLGLASCNLKEFPSFLRSQNKLEVLALPSNRIEGLILKWMSSVATRTLKALFLGHNSLTGFEQPISILPWTNLCILGISYNMLQGALPIPQPSIIEYEVSNNRFSGEISPLICNLTSLLALDLSNNNLTGSLPHCLADFSDSLTILQLQNNSLYGNIPQTYKSGCKLRVVNLGQNGFTGTLSRSLANCMELEALVLGDNHLNDTFPSWLGVLSKLKVLILGSNLFHGAIVKSKTKLDFPSLQIIDLSNNAFTGEFPFKYFENWTSMRSMDEDRLEYMHANFSLHFSVRNGTLFRIYDYTMVMTNKGMKTNYGQILEFFTAVDLSSNRFEGGIPEVFGTLKELHLLNLSNNILTGYIPSSLGNMEQLEALDLSGNHLSGEIPVQLTQLTFLEILNVSGNNLTGPIPTGKQFDTFERSSFQGNPGLCGRPLPKRCRNDAGAPPPAPSNIDDEEGTGSAFNFGWKIVAIGYACGMVIGGVIGYVFATKKQEWLMKTFRIKQQRKRRVEIRGHNNRT